MRVRVHHYELRDNEYVPFIETDEANVYREVALVAQPGSQEAFLAAPEREVLLAGPRGTGKTLTLLTDFFAEVGAGWGANWKGVLIRQSMTGFPEIKSLCAKVIPRIWPNARFNQNQNVWTWPAGETLKLAYFDETSDYRTYIGQSFTWVGFEELTQYKNDQPYKQMLACLRSAVPNIPFACAQRPILMAPDTIGCGAVSRPPTPTAPPSARASRTNTACHGGRSTRRSPKTSCSLPPSPTISPTSSPRRSVPASSRPGPRDPGRSRRAVCSTATGRKHRNTARCRRSRPP